MNKLETIIRPQFDPIKGFSGKKETVSRYITLLGGKFFDRLSVPPLLEAWSGKQLNAMKNANKAMNFKPLKKILREKLKELAKNGK